MTEPTTTETPQDDVIPRRAFVARMGALTAAASTGALLHQAGPALAAGRKPVAGPVEVRREALDDLTELTIAEAATLIAAGRVSPLELVDAYLARIEQFDSTYKAFNTVLADQARAKARELSGKKPRSALHGIPLAIKDNYYTKGVRTTGNSWIFQANPFVAGSDDFVPAFDATSVARLKRQGAIVLGKTQMGPLATSRATTPDGVVTTVNAWTPETPSVNPGGSSTGSGTATAGRMATSSIGTQTGGSITGPSNAQNLTGLKPTLGRTSVYGVIPLTYTRDHSGPLARDALDAAIMLQAMAGPDPSDPRTRGLPEVPDFVRAASTKGGRVRYRTRLGVTPDFTSGTSPTATLRADMLAKLADAGVEVVDVSLPAEWDLLTSRFNDVRLPERTEAFLEYMKQDLRLFGVSLNSWMQGLFLSGDEWLKGQRAKLVLLQRVLDDVFSQCDAVVQSSPVPFDIIGLPEIAFPIGFRPNSASGRDIPEGAIIGGKPYGEERLLSIVAAYQQRTDWHLRRPPDPAAPAAKRRARMAEFRLTPEEVVEQTE
jgi:aspartyl-tRNA(Asn)/glutamyl-tRNA(Gln) amidotransferase subunit A